MTNPRQLASNQDKINFLLLAFDEIKQRDKNHHPVFYTLSVIRFNTKIPMLVREPSTTDIKQQIEKYSSTQTFNPDQIIVELYTGKSHNVKKPFAVYKLDFKKDV